MGPVRQNPIQTRVTTIHFASSTTHAKCNNTHSSTDVYRSVITAISWSFYKDTL